MNIKSTIRIVANGTAWSFLGVVLTVAFFYMTEYRNPYDFRVYIDDDINLVEVRERIPSLEILYNGEDILQSGREIRLLQVTLRNEGKTIIQQDYDQQSPFGLRIPDAIILNAEVRDSNSDYLKEKILRPGLARTETVSSVSTNGVATIPTGDARLPMDKLIFEKGKFVTLKMFVLRPKGASETKVAVLGKIANIDRIAVEKRGPRRSNLEEPSPVFLLYFFGGYILVLVFLVLLLSFLDSLERRERRKKIAAFISTRGLPADSQRAIMDRYENAGLGSIAPLLRKVATEQTVDFNAHIRDQLAYIRGSPFRLLNVMMSPLRWLRRLDISRLPPEVFTISGSQVSLNSTNRDFILEFYAEMGEIAPGEKGRPQKEDRSSSKVQQTVGGDAGTRAEDGTGSGAPQP